MTKARSKSKLCKLGLAVLLASGAALVNIAQAADELVVKVSRNGTPVTGLSIVVDGATSKGTDDSGLARFDLGAGAHSVQIIDGDVTLHSFRFNTASGQLADVIVRLGEAGTPNVTVETYFPGETLTARAQVPTGNVSGRVTMGGRGVADATVSLQGATTLTATTGPDGEYALEAPRGLYTVTVSTGQSAPSTIRDYRVISGTETLSDFRLRDPSQQVSIAAPVMEEITVIGSMTGVLLQESERYSVNVVNTLGVEQLARFGDTDVAASIIRVPSVSVQDGKFIFIRGLGDRYVTSSLNGATMPSTDPNKRTVPLDLFPSNMVQQLDVKKTFLAGMPGESTGGNLVINTRTDAEDNAGRLSVSMGYVSKLTFQDALVDDLSGSFDLLGIDDGTRGRPVVAWAISQALQARGPAGFSQNTRESLGRLAAEAILDGWDFDEKKAAPNGNFGLSYGGAFYLPGVETEVTYYASGNYRNQWNRRLNGINRTYGGVDAALDIDDFAYEQYGNTINMSGLVAVGFDIADSRFQSNTLVSRVTESFVRLDDGFDGDELRPSRNWTIAWEERQFLSQQFTGEHLLGESGDWKVNWQGTASRADRYAPDRREVRFDLRSSSDTAYSLEPNSILRRYDELNDINFDGSVDVEYLFDTGKLNSAVRFGGQMIKRERNSDTDVFGIQGGILAVDIRAPNGLVSDVFNSDNITGRNSTGFNFLDKTLPSDSYDADMTLNSVYGSYDALWNARYQIVLGLRYESYEQTTDTFSLQGAQEAVQSVVDDDVFLPSLSFNWFITDDQQIRFAVTRTVARPDFKETANATFYDNEFNFRVRGNPLLRVSEITNYDIRWEKYWSDTESISIGAFYKDMKDPIERVVQRASGTAGNSRTFANAEKATLRGVELDLQKTIPLNPAFTQSVFLALNASYIDSEVTLANQTSRELQGAPKYTANFIIGFDDIARGHEITLLFNQSGDTIVDVGVSGQPDIILEPRLDLNLTYRWHISEAVTLRARAVNLLDSRMRFTQGGRPFQGYKMGYEISAGIDWSF